MPTTPTQSHGKLKVCASAPPPSGFELDEPDEQADAPTASASASAGQQRAIEEERVRGLLSFIGGGIL